MEQSQCTGPFVTHNTGQESSAGSRPVAFMLTLVTTLYWISSGLEKSVVDMREGVVSGVSP